MEYAEKGDLYKVSMIYLYLFNYTIVTERLTSEKKVLFRKGHLGFLLLNLFSS